MFAHIAAISPLIPLLYFFMPFLSSYLSESYVPPLDTPLTGIFSESVIRLYTLQVLPGLSAISFPPASVFISCSCLSSSFQVYFLVNNFFGTVVGSKRVVVKKKVAYISRIVFFIVFLIFPFSESVLFFYCFLNFPVS